METREDILRELREIAPKLASMEKINPYKLPEEYFLDFKNELLQRIKFSTVQQELKEFAPGLADLEKPFAMETPAGYFSNFSHQLVKKIRAKEVALELAEIAPIFSKLEKVNALQVPADYFSAFPGRMLKQVRVQQKAGPSIISQWIESANNLLDDIAAAIFKPKYSVAFAGFATMIIIGVMMLIKVQQCNDLECKLAQLSTDEINNYLDNKSDAYSDEVFEMKVEDNAAPAPNSTHVYKDALKDVDDAALNSAITD